MHVKKEKYQELLKTQRDYKRLFMNFCQSFFFGGLICLIGQAILLLLEKGFHFETMEARVYMIGIIILLAALLSSFGIYDRIGQIAKAGSVIPITGFANSMVSSAMEYRPEGFILGIGANTFKLAGSVVALGVVSAYLVGVIRYIFEVLI